MFAQRTLGSSGGKHCKSLEGNVWRKVVSRYKKTIFERDQRFFAVIFIANGFGQCTGNSFILHTVGMEAEMINVHQNLGFV